ncbi:hypothetical protein HanIR_Chr02g0055921 [Helianthus annuus]|nr:hypothetical protein HanIR_Chr02g0055921 [Helianthus annuus]
MDQSNNFPSFLKLIEKDGPLFLLCLFVFLLFFFIVFFLILLNLITIRIRLLNIFSLICSSKMIGIKKLNRKGKQVFFYDENLSSKVCVHLLNYRSL